ncbi:hypothetical protein GGI07_005335 [Coemansia sp. Benny D115]|nr:hypothetical protein GGI07_005335 [Coemansia sp. Benny D115]
MSDTTAHKSPVRIVIAGGNYAGLNTAKVLYSTLLAAPETEKAETATTHRAPPEVQITIIDRRDGFLHFIGITRGLTEPEYGEQLWVPYSSVGWMQHPSIKHFQATVKQITPTHVRVASLDGTETNIEFDYLVIALGEGRFAPVGTCAPSKDVFVKQLDTANQKIKAAKTVTVVGGGAVGIELAADIKCDFGDKQVTLVHSRALPLPGPFKDEFRQIVVDMLRNDIGVDLVLGDRAISQEPASGDMLAGPEDEPELIDSTSADTKLTLTSGRTVQSDLAIRCLGTRSKYHAPLISLPQGNVLDPTGIRVKDTMQVDSPEYSNIYACGDICSRDQVKLAGVAMYGGYIAARNVARSILCGKDAAVLEDGERYPPKIMLLMGKDHFALQFGDDIWDTERARPFAPADMGLDNCIKALSLDGSTPDYEKLL